MNRPRRHTSALRIAFLLACLPAALVAGEPSFEIEDGETRLNDRQPPVKIMDAVGMKPGMTIGEIGAGTGRMTMWIAERVGPAGMVYANDIDRDALHKLAKRAKREGMDRVETIVGEVEDPLLPEGALDIVFMINVYHHADDPVALVRNALPALKPGGFLAIVECDPDKVDWAEEHGCASRKRLSGDLERAGYEMIRVETFLDEDGLYLARPRSERP
jgi:ubiquinone/menaquinone biosynthesis C-methylase UbiE